MSFGGKSKGNLNIVSSILIMAFRSTILWILRTVYLFQEKKKKQMFSSIMLLFWLSCEEWLFLIGGMWVQNNLSPVQPHSDSGFKSKEPVFPEPASISSVVRIFGFDWHLKRHVNFKK